MRPGQRVAVWLYARPRLRRFFKAGFALWFCALWVVAVAPTAVADMPMPVPYAPAPSVPSVPSISSVPTTPYSGGSTSMPVPNVAFGDMTWSGLQDTYGVPISYYRVSTVGPLEAAMTAVGQQLHGLSLFSVGSWVSAFVAGFSQTQQNIYSSGVLGVECACLIFVAGLGIWFLQFALSATWLQWLAGLAQPIVQTLQAMVNHYLVMSFALLACILYGAYVYLARGKGQGLGVIAGGLGIMALVYLVFMNPVADMLGPNGVMSIGQYLGFEVAEGAINNGALAPGNSGAQLGALISLLCTALVRDQIQMVNFGTVIDNVPGCGSLWSAAIMSGQQDGPAHAMGSCDPAAMTYAQELGLGSAGLFAVVLFVEFWIMLALFYIGFHVILSGFSSFWRLLVLVVIVPVSVAPGALRRYGKHQGVMAVRDGLVMFGSLGGLAVIAIMDGSVLAGGPPGSGDALQSPLGREVFVLVISVGGAGGYHFMLKHLRNGLGFWGHWHRGEDWLQKRQKIRDAKDFFSVNLTGNSRTGRVRLRHMKRVGRPDDELAMPMILEYHGGKPKEKGPPGREPPQPGPINNYYNINNYYYGGTGGPPPGGTAGGGSTAAPPPPPPPPRPGGTAGPRPGGSAGGPSGGTGGTGGTGGRPILRGLGDVIPAVLERVGLHDLIPGGPVWIMDEPVVPPPPPPPPPPFGGTGGPGPQGSPDPVVPPPTPTQPLTLEGEVISPPDPQIVDDGLAVPEAVIPGEVFEDAEELEPDIGLVWQSEEDWERQLNTNEEEHLAEARARQAPDSNAKVSAPEAERTPEAKPPTPRPEKERPMPEAEPPRAQRGEIVDAKIVDERRPAQPAEGRRPLTPDEVAQQGRAEDFKLPSPSEAWEAGRILPPSAGHQAEQAGRILESGSDADANGE